MRKLKHHEIDRPTPEALSSMERHPIIVLVENIRSAHNVGSILRTSDAVRAERVFLTGFSPPASHRGVHKSALGAQDTVPWQHVQSSVEIATRLKADGVTLVALELTTNPTRSEDLPGDIFPVCLMVGNEIEGLSEDLLAWADFALEIPQYGAKQSLNVSVATGIAMYDLLRLYLDRRGN